MQHLNTMKCYFISLAVICLGPHLISQTTIQKSPTQHRNPVQVIVSGNHPDAIGDGETVIYDNRKGIDLRSFERPIKTTIPLLDSVPETEQVIIPNESLPEYAEEFLAIPESKLQEPTEFYEGSFRNQIDSLHLPDVRDDIQELVDREPQLSILPNDVLQPPVKPMSKYTGTAAQNIFLMNSLGIKPGWEKGAKWPDGSKVDGYSLVDWIRYGMGVPVGISKIATKQNRKKLYETYYRLGTE
tara:strand:- start:221 stop:946 length:726 start_codon:yes stop_codon:yes gene_type:complete